MIFPNEFERLVQGNWSLDCHSILLKSRSSRPTELRGPGEVALSSDHSDLRLKAICDARHLKKGQFGLHFSLNRLLIPAGQILPEDEFWDITAHDTSGRTWRCERVLPEFEVSQGRDDVKTIIARASPATMACSSPHPAHEEGSYWLNLWVLSRIDAPFNSITKRVVKTGRTLEQEELARDVWTLRWRSVRVSLHQERKELLAVRCTTSQPFPTHFRERLMEGLHLVLGRPVEWSICCQRIDSEIEWTIRSVSRRTLANVRQKPPLPPTQICWPREKRKFTSRYHDRLLRAYLSHTADSSHLRHPIHGLFDSVFEASAARFIDSQALTITIAVEALLALEFPEAGGPTRRLKLDVATALSLLQAGNWRMSGFLQRVEGILSNMLGTRAQDRLDALAARGAVRAEHIRSWQKLRNVSAHRFLTSGIEPDELRKCLRESEVLFYHLIFRALGYKGPYLDFSELGWPVREYPPGPSPSQ